MSSSENSKAAAYCNYLGERYPIYAVLRNEVKKPTITLDKDRLICQCPDLGEVDLYEPLKSFYVKSAKKHFEKRLRYYQKQFKEKYKSFKISNDDSRWGSCDSQKRLTFHWKLMMFPQNAIDYVIVHEMCHLSHMNHDRSFWRLVGKHCPSYKDDMKIIGSEKTRSV